MRAIEKDLFVEKVEAHRRLMAAKPRDDAEATDLVRRMMEIESEFGSSPPRTREGVVAGLRFIADHTAEGMLDEDLVGILLEAAIEWIEGASRSHCG